MKATIRPTRLKGSILAPASKSSMQRACAAALLNKGVSRLLNPGHSNDDKAAIGIIQALGATVTHEQDALVIKSGGVQPIADTIHCGESGLSIRMFTPLVALSNQEITINGSGSLLTRPMDFFDEVLPQLGVKISSQEGKLPMTVQGPLQPRNITMDGSLSSQFLTGLLMAYGQTSEGSIQEETTITVKDLKSKPYIDLTLDVMKQFGLNVPVHSNYEKFVFSKQPTSEAINSPVEYVVEGDWSGGAFLLVAGLIAGPVTVRGLDLTSTQADRAIIDALMAANAAIAMDAKGITVHPGEMDGFYFDATDCPDLFPPLVALAAYCNGQTTIRGVSRLMHKESNRALTLQDEFDKMGVFIELEGDTMTIHGSEFVKGADVHSNHDHRIAMACAVAALNAVDETVIDEAGAVNKSYPDFFKDLEKLGADVSLDNKIKLHE
ncbi:MAG: 3-phosphoshikimate 1-carboxyvinyltransferase [Chitinophagaceae bacterium]|nr:3-phosphoshikimate 1-carboxyvinyltransferase [Chitinophagaceae bacterium]